MKKSMNDNFVLPLDSSTACVDLVGGKAMSLGKLISKKFPVPPGFSITTQSYEEYLDLNDLRFKIESLIGKNNELYRNNFSEISKQIRSFFLAKKIPAHISEKIYEIYENLQSKNGLAVRSSATLEDSDYASFAGQLETYLNIRKRQDLLEAVCKCWSSLWTEETINYRQKTDTKDKKISMAVIVQTMVSAKAAGVLFTANPITGNRNEVIINANYGLGESVVSGLVTPDTYILDKRDLSLKDFTLGLKEKQIVSATDQGITTVPVDETKRKEPVLTELLQKEISSFALSIENSFDDVPQDIEWVITDDSCWIVQTRPITQLPKAFEEDFKWIPPEPGNPLVRRQIVEYMPDPISPLFESVYLHEAIDKSAYALWDEINIPLRKNVDKDVVRPFFVTVNGYAYQRTQTASFWKDFSQNIRYYIYIFRKSVNYLYDEALPNYKEVINFYKSIDYNSLENSALLNGIQKLSNADSLYWHHASCIIMAAKITDSLLNYVLKRINPNLTSGVFLQGFPSRNYKSHEELEKIAERFLGVENISELLEQTKVESLLTKLTTISKAQPILNELLMYIDKYGHQVYNYDFAEPTLAEEPLPILLNLKALITNSNNQLSVDLKEMALNRDKRTKDLLGSIGFIKRKVVSKFLKLAQYYNHHREEVIFHIASAWPVLRKLALELGHRLTTDGAIESPEDIFFLTNKEINSLNDSNSKPMLTLVQKRRELQRNQRTLIPPATVPPEYRLKVFPIYISGIESQIRNTDKSLVLKGFSVSPGRITGTASVISSPTDFDKMQDDTILVCPTVTPAWTPLFARARGLVTDIGGVLAHCSIVAREYCIPAVMGTGEATQKIKHGQKICIDGDKGTVTLL